MAYATVTIGSGSAQLVVAANHLRKSVILTNEGSSKVYIGNDSSVTTASTVSLEPQGKLTEDSGGQRMYLGDFYAIAEDATNDVRYWERTGQ